MKVKIKIDYVGFKHIIDNLDNKGLTYHLLKICWENSNALRNYWLQTTPNYKQYELIRKWLLDYNKQYYEMYYFVEDWLTLHKRDNWKLNGGGWEDMSYYEVEINNGLDKKIVTDLEGFDKFIKNIVDTETIYTIELKEDKNNEGLIKHLKELEDK